MSNIESKKSEMSKTLHQTNQGSRIVHLELKKIRPNPQQPRKRFDPESIDELARSIEWHGLLQPISVQQDGDSFVVVAGERRFQAYKKLQRDQIEAIIVDGNPRELALIENIQREDLHPLDLADALLKLQDDYSYTDSQIADIIGKSRTTVNELLRINSLPGSIKEECRMSDTVTKSVLLQVARGEDDQQKLALWDTVKGLGSARRVKAQRAVTRSKKKDGNNLDQEFVTTVRQLSPKIDLVSHRELISQEEDYQQFVRLRDKLNSAIVVYEKNNR